MGTGCKRRSLPWPHPPLRSRSLLPQRGNTPSGSEAPSWLPSPPSNRCGSPSRNTTSAAHPLSTGSASKRLSTSRYHLCLFVVMVALSTREEKLNCQIRKHINDNLTQSCVAQLGTVHIFRLVGNINHMQAYCQRNCPFSYFCNWILIAM